MATITLGKQLIMPSYLPKLYMKLFKIHQGLKGYLYLDSNPADPILVSSWTQKLDRLFAFAKMLSSFFSRLIVAGGAISLLITAELINFCITHFEGEVLG